MVWDTAAGKAVPNTTEGVTAALSGTFEVNGETCRTAFDHLCDEVSKYTLEYTSEITGLDRGHRELRHGVHQRPAGRHPHGTGHAARLQLPFAPSHRGPRWPLWPAGIGVEGGGASTRAARRPSARPRHHHPGVQLRRVGEYRRQRGEHGEELDALRPNHHQAAQPHRLHVVRELELHQHEPDANKIINEVLPNISTIVTVDPYWTWTAKYSDYVLPACNYWEKWDFSIARPGCSSRARL